MVNQEGAQSPGEPQTQQDVKDVAPYGVGHSHVSHAWRGARQAESKVTGREEAVINGRWREVTLSSYNQTRHAVWDAGPRCQEGDAHDVIWDV